jgi:hypothetical protein
MAEPGTGGGSAGEGSGQECLLDLVLRILDRAEDAVTVHVDLPLMTIDEMAECLLVASLRAGDEIAVHRGFLPATSLPARMSPLQM